MSVKLSELLEAGARAIERDADDYRQSDADTIAAQIENKLHALRAIAPALVEAAQNHGSLYHTHIPEKCIGCKVYRALAEAGVTCD